MIWTSSGRGWHDDHRLQPQLECQGAWGEQKLGQFYFQELKSQGACGEQKNRTILVRFFKDKKYCLISNVKGPVVKKNKTFLQEFSRTQVSNDRGKREKWDWIRHLGVGWGIEHLTVLIKTILMRILKHSSESKCHGGSICQLLIVLMKRQLTLCFNFFGEKAQLQSVGERSQLIYRHTPGWLS